MANVFQKVAQRFEDSMISIPLTLAFLLGVVISLAAFYGDYKSSYNGYIGLPTQKVSEIVWLIALLPQVGQIIFGAAFTVSFNKQGKTVKANWIYAIITIFLFLWDNGTDVWFKTFEGTASSLVWVIAIFESLTVYTIGSEILLIASFGMFLYFLPIALRQTGLLIAQLSGTEDINSGSGPPKGMGGR